MKKIFTVFATLLVFEVWSATFVVTDPANTMIPGTLPQEVANANASPGADTIVFNILTNPAGTVYVINTSLNITGPLFINGATQPGYAGSPLIELSGGTGAGIVITTSANNSELVGLAVTGFTAQGIIIASSFNKISGCYIGIRANGTTTLANSLSGIDISSGSNGNIIGGASRNIISGNSQNGILLTNSDDNYIFNNLIGLALNGITTRGNGQSGINFNLDCDHNRIGGVTQDSMNVIGANGNQGILFTNTCNFNQVVGNYIGCALDGSTDVGNSQHGISFSNSDDNSVGGSGTSSRNIISGNGSHGIQATSSHRLIIKSNYIGVTSSGLSSMGNTSHGIQLLGCRNCIIGGAHSTEGNIISNNSGVGIELDKVGNIKSSQTIIQGNYIGTDKDGLQNFGNNVFGIIMKGDSCVVGGSIPALGNIIANTKILCGLFITDGGAEVIRYNLIGLYIDSTDAGNKTDGIFIGVENAGNSSNNSIIEYNAIAYNKANGINIGDAYNSFSTNENFNRIRFNRIFCNAQKGIYLSGTVNDVGNNGKTAPGINTALSTDTKLVGLVPSGLVAGDTIDVYRMTDCVSCDDANTQGPQGKYYVGFTIVQADGSWTYTSSTPMTDRLVATATDASGNTSQFSSCFNPCGAAAKITTESVSIFLKDNASQNFDLSGAATFSALNPAPGHIYWMLNTADTSNYIGKNTSQTIVLSGIGNGDLGAGVHTVYFVANQVGCMDTASIQIRILYIPNLITPNGDGKNDQWTITNKEGLYDVSIFNRWGDRIYKEENYTDNWKADQVSDGTYYYLIEGKEDKEEQYKGWLHVVH